jgi:hypothetical protein
MVVLAVERRRGWFRGGGNSNSPILIAIVTDNTGRLSECCYCSLLFIVKMGCG